MIAVKDAIKMTLNEVTRLGAAEVDLKEASGYILAEDIFSDIDMPPFEKSSMDGYAFKAADCQNNSTVLDVVGSIPAGVYPDFEIEKGQAAKIMTGAPLPEGADSVQMVEKTQPLGENRIEILEPVPSGRNVARKSEVIKEDSKVLSKGLFISPAVAGALATVGKATVSIFNRPKVGILVTGDELVDIDRKPEAGQIRNSNGYSLYSQVVESGALPELFGIAPDKIEYLTKSMELGLEKDVLLISGGVSIGDHDFVEDVMLKHGLKIFYDKVNIKPGKPTVFGRTSETLVFGLPGNPVSASTIFEVIVRPALRKMMGFSYLHNVKTKATLEKKYATKTKRENYQLAWTLLRDNLFCTTAIQSKGSADVVAFAKSNSYLITTQKKQEFNPGDTVDVMLRPEFWKSGGTQHLVD